MAGEVCGIALLSKHLPESKSRERESKVQGSLAHVIDRAKEGDSLAFEQLMTLHQHRVVAIAWRFLGNQEDARDAAQEVFLRVYRHLKKFRSGEDFSAWLYRITINVCRDSSRRRGPKDRLTSFEDERNVGTLANLQGTDDVEAAAILSQEHAIVALALDRLSIREREALVLRDFEGLSTEEVARILGSSATTVRSQICSARRKIKLHLDRALNRGRQEG